MKKFLFLLAAAGLAAGQAGAAVVTANTTGWTNESGNSDNSFGSNMTANNFTGFEGEGYNNFFQFTLTGTPITSATLSIFNPASNTTIDPDAVYSLHAAADTSYAGLMAGPSLGSITLGAADNGTGHFVDIALNAAGIAYLNSVGAGEAYLGGTVSSVVDRSQCFDCVAAFGYNGGDPAATLTLNGSSPAPEPASWAMMLGGFGLIGGAMRSRRKSVSFA